MVPSGATLADIGTDHANLPIYLVQNRVISSAIAGEVHSGPYQTAQAKIKSLGMLYQISLRFGDGLSILAPGEADTVVIAGMGGATIVEILMARFQVTRSINRLVLQPMVGASTVRCWLAGNNWTIINEELVCEEERLYEIIVAEQGASSHTEPILYEIGPILWANKHPLLKIHINNLVQQFQRIAAEMSISLEACKSPRYCEILKKIEQLEAKRICL